MSSTRYSRDGAFHQERFCSAPEILGDAINGLTAAKRIALIEDAATREILWLIQSRSLATGGLRELCSELVAEFPERLTTPTLTKLRALRRTALNDPELRQLRSEFCIVRDVTIDEILGRGSADDDSIPTGEWDLEFYERRIGQQIEDLPGFFTRCCVDPDTEISHGVWFFRDVLDALRELRNRIAQKARQRLADTAVTGAINGTLDFFHASRRMVLIEGVAGIGRSATTRAWCDAHPGLVRYVEVPSSSDDRSFYASVARALGVASGASYKAQQIKVRIEEMLLTSGLALVFDESQYLFGQFIRPRRTPDRILWLKTLFDSGTPIALIAHTDFSKWQQHFVTRTLWSDEQFERRLNRRVILPAVHPKEDMLKIAKAHMPYGEPRSWKLLAAYALGTEKKQASAIVEALASATYHAQQDGRDRADFGDIEWALMHVHGFLTPAGSREELQTPSTAPAKRVKGACRSPKSRADSHFLMPVHRNGQRLHMPVVT